jgi:hypothetical protein
MELTRIYYNGSNETLRVDKITVDILPPIYQEPNVNDDSGLQMRIGPQRLVTTILGSHASLAGSRQVSNIELVGDYDDYDQTGAPYNMTWATKTLGNDQVVRFNMSELPGIGDDV